MSVEVNPYHEARFPRYYRAAHAVVGWAFDHWPIQRPINVEGIDNFPLEGPVVIVPEHRSIADPFYVSLVAPRALYGMAKNELFSIRSKEPYLLPVGLLLRPLGAFSVDRDNPKLSTIKRGKELLAEGKAVLTFLEGTSKNRGKVDPGKTFRGAAQLAVGASLKELCPVIPVGIASESLSDGEMVHIVIDEAIYPEDYSYTIAGRKILAERLTESIVDRIQVAHDRASELRNRS